MKTYDWIVVGAGITGAALGYELAQNGLRVLLIEQDIDLKNAEADEINKLINRFLRWWGGGVVPQYANRARHRRGLGCETIQSAS